MKFTPAVNETLLYLKILPDEGVFDELPWIYGFWTPENKVSENEPMGSSYQEELHSNVKYIIIQ